MTPQEAKEQFDATHYSTTLDGVTPQMYYKKETNSINKTYWVYLSYANLWMGSEIKIGSQTENNLKEIK